MTDSKGAPYGIPVLAHGSKENDSSCSFVSLKASLLYIFLASEVSISVTLVMFESPFFRSTYTYVLKEVIVRAGDRDMPPRRPMRAVGSL